MDYVIREDKVLKALFEDFEPISRVVTIDNPTSDDYNRLHSQDSLGVQRDIAEYAESYISLGKFFAV